MKTPRLLALTGLLFVSSLAVSQQDNEELVTSPLAEAFGSPRLLNGARLSPNGKKISYLQFDTEGRSALGVINIETHEANFIAVTEPDSFQFDWCGWANETRLLCGMFFFGEFNRRLSATSRLIAVNADGSDFTVILPQRLGRFQDNLLDWIPDDFEHVLITIPSGFGDAIARLNIYDSTLSDVDSGESGTVAWLTDGHGNLRAYVSRNRGRYRWYGRASEGSEWIELHDADVDDWDDKFELEGFGENANELLVTDVHEGRRALFAINLANGDERRLVSSHPIVDVADLHFVGKYNRVAAAVYVEDRAQLVFFDGRLLEVHALLSRTLTDLGIVIIDEDWQRENYLVFASSDTDPGTYYHFDTTTNRLTQLGRSQPSLDNIELAQMKPIRYTARDGVEIPAYLTMPHNSERPPAVVLPHGGPRSRDYWGYDYLVQFLAANGYAVLQGNFRGSSGYGDNWVQDGAWKNWDLATADIIDGTHYLIEGELVDPARICAVGWSYGGYAALMSAAQTSDLYKCVISIAGVSNLRLWAMRLSEAAERELGIDNDLFKVASPARRAEDIAVPVLLFHGKWDLNVRFNQSESMERALRRANVPVEFIEYEETDHNIYQHAYRFDLLTRMADFLNAHIGTHGAIP